MLRLYVLLFLTLALLGCDQQQAVQGPPKAQSLTGAEVGHYCGMLIADHSGPKGQIHVQGRSEPYWFSSVSDTFSFTFLPEEPKAITAIYINDMSKGSWDKPDANSWIEARNAWFVIGSDAVGGMGGAEIAPFATRQQAETFVQQHGGKVVQFDEVNADQVLGQEMKMDHSMMGH